MHTIKKNIEILLLLIIVVVSLVLRFYKLSEIPNGFYVDEAAIGYNAYSFLETGKDEYGKSFPIFLRSFVAYSSPLYTYVTTLVQAFSGVSIFSTRFLAAGSGVIITFLVYGVARKLENKDRFFPLISAFVYAISPWSIFFSRGAFEANFALLLFLLAIYFVFKAKEKTTYFFLSSVFFALSTYAYQAERLLVLFLYPFSYWYVFGKKITRISVYSVILFSLFLIPQIVLLFTYSFSSRASGIFYSDAVAAQALKIAFLPSPISYVLSFLREFGSNYISYYSPLNLFFLPDPDLQRSIPDLSVFYAWMVIPLLVGLFTIPKYAKARSWWIIGVLFLVAPIAAALTKDPFSTLRSLPLLIPFVYVISLGTIEIYKRVPKAVFYPACLFVLAISVVSFWRSYFVLFPNERARHWDYGYMALAEEIKEKNNMHFVIDQSRVNPSYILLAFHLRYPPSEFQRIVDQSIKDDYYNGKDFNSYYSFRNIQTRNINWEEDIYKKQILVGDALSISESQAKEHALAKIFEIEDPLYETIFVGYETDPQKKCESINYMSTRCTINK